MRSRKAQLTVFMLIAVFIVVLTVAFFVFNDNTEMRLFLKQTKQPLELYVEECIKFAIVDGVVTLNEQGGFIYNYTPNLTTTQKVFAYSIYNGQNTTPSWPFMQREISRYIEDTIDACLDKGEFLVNRYGLPFALTTIYPERVSVELRYRLGVDVGEAEQGFEEFTASHDIPLGRMLELRDKVIADLLAYPNLMLLDKLYDTDFQMIINPYSGRDKVIEMINYSARLRNDPLIFKFAIRDAYSLPEPLTFDEFIDDTAVYVGVPLALRAECSHPCNYYDNTILFDIDERRGVINYVPDALDVGSYNITITIKDGTYTLERKFGLTVKG